MQKKEQINVGQYFLGLLECIHKTAMSYVAARYYIFVILAVILFYIIPKKGRWLVLLAASVYFCFQVSDDNMQLIVFGASILISYLAALILDAARGRLQRTEKKESECVADGLRARDEARNADGPRKMMPLNAKRGRSEEYTEKIVNGSPRERDRRQMRKRQDARSYPADRVSSERNAYEHSGSRPDSYGHAPSRHEASKPEGSVFGPEAFAPSDRASRARVASRHAELGPEAFVPAGRAVRERGAYEHPGSRPADYRHADRAVSERIASESQVSKPEVSRQKAPAPTDRAAGEGDASRPEDSKPEVSRQKAPATADRVEGEREAFAPADKSAGGSKASKNAGSALMKFVLALGIIFSAAPLIVTKFGDLIESSSAGGKEISWIIPIGLSFYSMQIISYLVDVYRGDCSAQKNPLKYTLYVSFFPIIIQGPISRYSQLSETLYKGTAYDFEKIMRGVQLIIWGVFLKYMIAEKSAIVVDYIFENSEVYSGCYILLAGILYSIQLYTDFLSCVTISRGVAGLFGIELVNNFNHPYFSTSIKEFWRRWHISLSEWLRDYIYIPLGGNRKGKVRKYFNLICTFAVSGLWHGSRWKYIVWGLMHAVYQIIGDAIHKPKDAILEKISLSKDSKARKIIDMIITSFLVMVAWIIFRADTLAEGFMMIGAMFSNFNPWIFFDNSIFDFGLSQKDFEILAVSVLILIAVSAVQENGIKIRDWFNRQSLIIRWIIYLCAIWSVWIFGTYGIGFDAADFIYGGF